MNIGMAIKIALVKKGMKQHELADKIGVSTVYISRICNKKNVGMNAVSKIAEALDMKVSDLVALGE